MIPRVRFGPLYAAWILDVVMEGSTNVGLGDETC
jgi:hypothetical protein